MRKANLNDIRQELNLRLSKMLEKTDAPNWKADRDSGTIFWVDSDGGTHDIRKLTDMHLANLYAFLLWHSGEGRNSSSGEACSGDETGASTPFDGTPISLDIPGPVIEW